MKFSYRNSPILEKIEKKSLGFMGYYEIDEKFVTLSKDHVQSLWKKYAGDFQQNIYSLSQPFVDAYEAARAKLAIPELLEKTETTSGTFLEGKRTYCFSIKNNPESFHIVFFVFVGNLLYAFGEHLTYEDLTKKGLQFFWVSNSSGYQNNNAAISKMFFAYQGHFMLLLNFLKYAAVEVKELLPNKKLKDITCKYKNDTNSKITLLNSTWFTTLVKSDGFKVRGHFRLQPYGENLKERKLIWINDFEKSGYTAPARKLRA